MIERNEPEKVANRILLPVVNWQQARGLMTLAEFLVRTGARRLILVGLVHVAEENPLSQGAYRARQRRNDLTNLSQQYQHLPLEVDPRVRVTHDPIGELMMLVSEYSCDVLLLRMSPDNRETLSLPIDLVLSKLTCRVILQRGLINNTPTRLMIPTRGGPHASHALQLATAIGEATDIAVTQVHVAEKLSLAARVRDNEDIRPTIGGGDQITREINLRGDMEDLVSVIQNEINDHQLLVLGTTARRSKHGVLGDRTRAILDATTLPALVIYAPTEVAEPTIMPIQRDFSTNVDRWFAENTFDAEEFSDIGRLVALKQARGWTISVGLPALNEAETIGNVITTVRDALMDDYPLIDELVLIDSNSTDDTVAIAESLGIPVYRHPEILPEVGSYVGKGEALWKSLHVLTGDIIAWIDTDIVNIHPRFVYGLLGPLLVSSRVKYVKGFYRRPLRVGDKLQAGGGGRVTELVVRPMLNLFYPELSGLVQPLSGEYAGRREVLERLPFFTGYAVETGMLIDILAQHGLSAIAQVDLKERIHHNQSLKALSKMSFVIIQALLGRLDEQDIVRLRSEPSRSMKLIGDHEGRLYLDVEERTDLERPPMIALPAYRSHRKELRRQASSYQSGLQSGGN